MLKKHIALTGFMGSGKTTLGKKMACIKQLPFIDLDEYIEQKEKKSIIELFENGEEYFRNIETKYLIEVMSLSDQHIIALGGGTICYNDNLKIVQNNAYLYAILIDTETLVERLWKEKNKRPLLKDIDTKENLKNYIEIKLNERMPFYEQADFIITL